MKTPAIAIRSGLKFDVIILAPILSEPPAKILPRSSPKTNISENDTTCAPLLTFPTIIILPFSTISVPPRISFVIYLLGAIPTSFITAALFALSLAFFSLLFTSATSATSGATSAITSLLFWALFFTNFFQIRK